jgi:hypothetical protein
LIESGESEGRDNTWRGSGTGLGRLKAELGRPIAKLSCTRLKRCRQDGLKGFLPELPWVGGDGGNNGDAARKQIILLGDLRDTVKQTGLTDPPFAD